MFSFHRPKVYRSSTGCCICRAKSSRFTDSKKYEEDFLECFKLSTPRQGEICNACVLLVKRWKKLPAGLDRNWQHVVDARAGPGMKSMTKFKSKSKKNVEEKTEKPKNKKHFDCEYSPMLYDKNDGNEEVELAEVDLFLEDPMTGINKAANPSSTECEEIVGKRRKHKGLSKSNNSTRVSDFVDLDYWKRETLCCGTIFRGLHNEIMIDPQFMTPCNNRIAQYKLQLRDGKLQCKLSDGTITKVYSDSSSDSGYDESSNQEMSSENAFRKDLVGIEEVTSQIPIIN